MSKELSLIKAMIKGDYQKAIKLLDKGANINTNASNDTYNVSRAMPIHYALHLDKSVVKDFLQRGADVNAKDGRGETPLHYLASRAYGRYELVEMLIAHGAKVNDKSDSLGDTPIHKAASAGDCALIQLLFFYGAEINARDKLENTPLHNAVISSRREVIELLISHKAEVNSRNRLGNTPLHSAAINSNYEAIKLLIFRKAELNAKNNDGRTPLHLAASLESGNDVVITLLEHGADIKIKDSSGLTPIDIAHTNTRAMLEKWCRNQTVVTTCMNFIINPDTFTLGVLEQMFEYTTDIYTLRFPYTIANLFRLENQLLQKSIDGLVIKTLERLADQAIYGVDTFNFFNKVILRSAFNNGIINDSTKGRLKAIADDRKTLSHPEFLDLVAKVNKLERNVEIIHQNVKMIANSVNDLKAALRRKAKRDMIFGVAKIALSFVGCAGVDLLAGIVNFSEMAETSLGIFNLTLGDIGKALYENKKIIINHATEQFLKNAGLDPSDFLKTWYETSLQLNELPADDKTSILQPNAADQMVQATRLLPAIPKPILNNEQITTFAIKTQAAPKIPPRRCTNDPLAQALLVAVQENDVSVLKNALASGVNINLPLDHEGKTALHLATLHNALDIIDELLAVMDNLNVRDDDNRTPLHIAAMTNNYSAAKSFMARGFDKKAKNNKGQTPADLARENGHDDLAAALQPESLATIQPNTSIPTLTSKPGLIETKSVSVATYSLLKASPKIPPRSSTFKASTSNTQPVISSALKPTPKQTTIASAPSVFKPKPAAASMSFTAWLKEVQTNGQFLLSINEKVVSIHYTNMQKNDDEIEKILFTLNDYLKELPELERIDIEDRDIEHHSLTLTIKTKLDAKQIINILEKDYQLSNASSTLGPKPTATQPAARLSTRY